ncbi:MAG: MarR family transcriptional regulator [Caldilineaceae bacterium]
MANNLSCRPTRAELIKTFMQEISRMSTWAVMFHQAASLRMGLNSTDGKSVGVLRETGPLTAGELAELIGLTTGAVTGVIDRLEQRGFVRRVADPHDRRRVVIEPVQNLAHHAELDDIFGPLAAATQVEFLNRYTDEELAVILDFVRRGAELMKGQTARLNQKKRDNEPPKA